MRWLYDLVTNPFIITPISSWILAQIVKVIISVIINKKFDIKRLMGDGGMPSGHSATVMSLTVLTGIVFGCGSWQFAISAILTLIVGHDAMGVRRAAGMHAKAINELRTWQEETDEDDDDDFIALQEKLGHTPLEVLGGALLGILIPMVVGFFM